MIRVLSILAAVAALAVSAAPVASAGAVKAPPKSPGFFLDLGTTETLDLVKARSAKGQRGKSMQGAIIYNGHAGLGANARTSQVKDGLSNTLMVGE